MLKRIITGVVCLPILIVIVSLGGLWLRGAILVLSLIGLFEFYRALSPKILPIHFSAYIFTFIYIATLGMREHLLFIFSAFILMAFSMLVICYQKISFNDCIVTVCGFFYIPFLLSFVYLVRDLNIFFVWLIFISSSVNDTFAYGIGRLWGRHKLKNTPSPGKSWEGCIGGVLGAALIGFLYGHFVAQDIVFMATAISIVGAIFSQFGDLFASAIKRSVGIKDFGKILPGHGGILDRFDSIIAAAPMMYIAITMIGYLGL